MLCCINRWRWRRRGTAEEGWEEGESEEECDERSDEDMAEGGEREVGQPEGSSGEKMWRGTVQERSEDWAPFRDHPNPSLRASEVVIVTE